MALAVGNLLDTGGEKHRFNPIFLHLFYPLKPDFIHLHFIHLHFIHFNAIFHTYFIH